LGASVELLFLNNDYSLFSRVCRPFIKSHPQLCHDALKNNHIDILLKFIPVATIDILQYKNQSGDTLLLHAARLNHIEVMKVLLEHKDSKIFIEDIDKKKNNIFHILVLNSSSQETFDLLINYLLEKNISIQQKFDQLNQDHQTPLQLAVYKNNLPATKSLFKHFNDNICDTGNGTGDNLIHLAIRYGDLTMIKYLIEDGELIQQGNQSNLKMTPFELSQSLKCNDIIEYLKKKYSLDVFDDDDDDDDDD
jgi:ankyrin repeat protein